MISLLVTFWSSAPQNGYFHLGDITFRLRAGNSGAWKNYSSAATRTPVDVLPASRGELAVADLSPAFPADFPLQVTRFWAIEAGKLVLRFKLKNRSSESIEIGGPGIPIIFNDVLNDRSLEEAHAKCSFYDPYIGEDAGYLQVTHLSGRGPALVVVPDGKTPFEAYNPILDKPDRWGAKPVFTDPTPRGITFEGFYEWMVHTQAYAENIAGLGDEGGGGAWLAPIMKELVQPDKEELEKLQQFVDGVLWGGLQFKEGPHAYGVRKSLFYYQPDDMPSGYYRGDFDWSTWTSWNKAASERVDRSYDYPHVAAAYWVLYRLARNHKELVTNHPWDWYLDHAYETSIAMTDFAAELGAFGQMEGDIFLQILLDLKSEGRAEQAAKLEDRMRARAERWRREAYPFGSEMPWDSTGQEEVYAWTKYFGYEDKADVTLNAILGYDPTIPHWGYNGSARRYWDFIFAAKDRRLERQLHHYGSGPNAIPVLSEYREHPEDFYLLRVGYGGAMGPLPDIDSDGFPSAAFHGFPDMLRADPLTGDYGPNFFGHAWNAATYVVDHPQFGWLAFGGNLRRNGKTIEVTPLDSYRARVYVAPLGLWLTLEAGNFESVTVDTNTGRVRLGLAGATTFTQSARLRVEEPAGKRTGAYRPLQTLAIERGAWVVPLNKDVTWIELSAR